MMNTNLQAKDLLDLWEKLEREYRDPVQEVIVTQYALGPIQITDKEGIHFLIGHTAWLIIENAMREDGLIPESFGNYFGIRVIEDGEKAKHLLLEAIRDCNMSQGISRQ